MNLITVMKNPENHRQFNLRVILGCLLILSGAVLSSCGYFESDQAKLERARQLYQQNKFNQSIILAKKLLQTDSNNCPARVLLGQIQFAKFSLLDASETMNKAKQLECKDPAIFRVAIRSLMYQNKLAEAHELLQDPEFSQAGNTAQGVMLKGDIFFQQGDLANAGKLYNEYYAKTHDEAEYCLSQAKLLLLKKDYQAAIDKTRTCEKLTPSDDLDSYRAQVRYVKAHAQLNAGQTEQSMTTLKSILDAHADPKDPNINVQSALLLMKLNVSQHKIDAASKLADLLLQYVAIPEIYYVKGLQAEQEKHFDQAEQRFLAALKLNPNYRPSLLGMARLKYNEGNFEQARYYTGKIDALSGNKSFTEHLDEFLAEKYLQAGDLDSIINTLADDKKSQNLKSRYILALAYARKGERDKAWQVFHEIQTGLTDPTRKNLLEASLLVALGEYEQAETLFRKYSDAGNEYAIAGLAQLYIGRKKFAEAEKLLQKTLAHAKNQYKVTMLLVELYSLTNRRKQAFALLDSQLQTHQDKQAYQLLLAKLHYRYEEYQDTVKICRELQKTAPDNIEASLVMANAYIKLAQYEQAKIAYQNVVQKQPANVNAYLALAFLANKSGDVEQAIKYIEQALVYDPLNLKSIYAKVELLVAKHADKAAIEFAQSKADALKNTQTGSLLMAFAYDKTGDQQKAYINYRNALEGGSKDVRTALSAYHASVSVNGADKAEKELDNFLSANPSAANVYYAAGHFMKQGQYTLAEKYYLTYIKQNQKNPSVYNNLAWLKLKDGDTRTALEFAHQALALAPDSPAIQDTLGQVLLGAGDIDSAGKYLKAAYAKLGDDPSVKYHMALFYYHKNKPDEAKRLLHTITDREFPEQGEAQELLRKLTDKQP